MSPRWLKTWSCSLCIKIRFLAHFSSSSLITCSVLARKDVVIGFRYWRRFLLCRSLWEWRIWVKRRKRVGIAIQQYISVSFPSCANQDKEGRMHKIFFQELACIHKVHLGWNFSWCTVQLFGIGLLENHLRKERVGICSLTDCTHYFDVLCWLYCPCHIFETKGMTLVSATCKFTPAPTFSPFVSRIQHHTVTT